MGEADKNEALATIQQCSQQQHVTFYEFNLLQLTFLESMECSLQTVNIIK